MTVRTGVLAAAAILVPFPAIVAWGPGWWLAGQAIAVVGVGLLDALEVDH